MEDLPSSTNGTAAPSSKEHDVTSSKSTTQTEATSSTKSMTKEQATEVALSLLVQGRRHLLVQDIPNAIAALAESSQLLGEHYGEFADECAESYYYYGSALLEMARLDPDVLGDAVEGGEKGDDESGEDEENEGEDDDEEEASDEEESSPKSTEVEDIEMKDEDKNPKESEENEEKKPKESEENEEKKPKESEENEKKPEGLEPSEEEKSKTSDQNGEEKSKASGQEKEETSNSSEVVEKNESEASAESENKETKPKNEMKGKSLKVVDSLEPKTEKNDETEEETEEVTNLQLAWEVLELSKNIYKKQAETNPAAKPKLADALIRLAEVAIESENYTSAIEDLLTCLEIQTSSFPSDSRSLAETRYQLGVAYTFTTDFKEAIRNFEAAADIIKTRIENLKNPKEKSASKEEPHVFYTVEGEIEELESLLPDIKEKIADTIDLEAEAIRKVAENGADGAGPSTAESSAEVSSGFTPSAGSSNGHDAPSSSSKPALDITHLIRKKRKPDDAEAAESASPAKKVCAEPNAV